MSEPTAYPRSVTPGIETHSDEPQIPPPGVYVGLDWMRFTGPDEFRVGLVNMLESICGPEWEASKGAKYFKHGLHWKPGILVSWGHGADIFQVDIQGGRLRLMGGDDRMTLFRTLMEKGLKPTRIDGAIDFIDQYLDVCENAEASCRRREHCLLRKWSPNNEYEADGTPTRLLLKLGSRESAVCGRIYDKGLEQKAAAAGRWERLEVEWKDDRAITIGQQLYSAVCEGEWSSKLASLIFGAVDFRDQNGRSELSRRPRVGWWKRVIAGHRIVTVAAARKPKILERWRRGHVHSYGRTLLAMAEEVGEPVGEVVTWLLKGEKPSETISPVVAEFAREYTRAQAGMPHT